MRAIAASLIVLTLLVPVLPAHAQSGTIVCQRELADVERSFAQKRDRLSAAEAREIGRRLDLVPSYCASNSYSSAVTLSGLDQIRRRLDTVPQVAEVPSDRRVGRD